jgi:TetR/AcrR family transcriptional regulator, regulator of autoinduction and epiphytic fitness
LPEVRRASRNAAPASAAAQAAGCSARAAVIAAADSRRPSATANGDLSLHSDCNNYHVPMVLASPPLATLDGRLARGARARTAIVEALLGLIERGDLRPSAARVAERAGVSLRSVFQHFSDVESLFAAAAARQAERVAPLAGGVPDEGTLAHRLDAFVRKRTRLLEAISPVRRAAVLMEPFSSELQGRLGAFRALKAAEVRRVFAEELARRPPAARRRLLAALVAISSWNTWQALRQHQGLSQAEARRVLRLMLEALVRRG